MGLIPFWAAEFPFAGHREAGPWHHMFAHPMLHRSQLIGFASPPSACACAVSVERVVREVGAERPHVPRGPVLAPLLPSAAAAGGAGQPPGQTLVGSAAMIAALDHCGDACAVRAASCHSFNKKEA